MNREEAKAEFRNRLKDWVSGLARHVSADDDQWTIKGFIDVYRNVYTISADTKIVSKILEIHIFPKILEFAETNSFRLVLTERQNYYPDISFVSETEPDLKFALDLKTTYRLHENPEFCNGFTLGSHGEYFVNRQSRKNIQFPYAQYAGHFCLGAICSRTPADQSDQTRMRKLDELRSIVSVVRDFLFFVCEKWEIASDRRGSGNTANIGSINRIEDTVNGNGMFKHLGERWFDEYWMNYGKITLPESGKKITRLADYLVYRGQDPALVNPRASPRRRKQ